MTDPCAKMKVKISSYLDGELPSAELAELESHLENCPRCRAVLQENQAVDDLLHEHISLEPPPEVELAGIWDELEDRINCRQSLWQKIKNLAGRPVFLLPAAAAALTAAALLVILPLSPDQVPVQVSQVESVSSTSGDFMMLQTAESGQPIIWILPEKKKESLS